MNPRLAGISPSLIRALAAKRKLSSIDLGLGEPTLKPSMRHFDAAAAWVAEHGCPYTANAGDEALREAIARRYAYPGMTSAKNVCVTSGSQEALHASIVGLLDPAQDELLIVEPAFGAYAKIAELAGVTVRTVAMRAEDGFAFDVERILAAIAPKTRMLVICSPSNPTGRVLRCGEARALAAALLGRGGAPITVLLDEVYRELCYIEDVISLAHEYPHTLVVNSLSKSNALTGLRLGWALAPGKMVDAIVQMHALMTSTASTFAQRVAFSIFTEEGALSEQHAWYRERADAVTELLATLEIPATPIEGAFYSVLWFPGSGDSLASAMRLAEEEDVLMVPGVAFGASSEGALRISWVAPLERLSEGLRRAKRRLG
jgi:aspartate/methionine/tyrosine aminotransferase